MAYRSLPDTLLATLRAAGLPMVELPGWEQRGRPASTGGFDPVGVLCHHTGSYDSMTDAENDYAYAMWMATQGRSDLPAPLCHLALSAEGVVYVCAAGRANHAGTARPSGSVAGGDGNALYIGIEAMNSGTQGWGRAQYDAYVLLCAVLSLKVTGNSANTVRAHYEISVTGKWDPGDPNGIPFGGHRVMDMNKFRADVNDKMRELSTPQEEDVTPEQVNKMLDQRDDRLRREFRAETEKAIHEAASAIRVPNPYDSDGARVSLERFANEMNARTAGFRG